VIFPFTYGRAVGLLVKILALSEKLLADLAQYTCGSSSRAVSVEVVSQEAVSAETVSAPLVLLDLPTTTLRALPRDALLAHDQVMAQFVASPAMAPVKRSNAISTETSAPGNLSNLLTRPVLVTRSIDFLIQAPCQLASIR